ncbi:MAG: class I mannose-6-phosphate isomerase [Bacteroidetes bacterium]|nr:class I mannose-6-phosphate isomerase [Bacteroidota bacterium]
MNPYPLLFEPSLHIKVWGGRAMEISLNKSLPPNEPVGESWEIYSENRIANGEFSGLTLGEVTAQFPNEIVGSCNVENGFPLLIKFLDAQDWLSVQVHPDDTLALILEGEPRGKTECWYILDAAPNAEIIYGFSTEMNKHDFRTAIENGNAKNCLQFVSVKAGDFVNVPAGTVHAIGPGIVLYELQQTSDTTYRLYDWERTGLDGNPRELHIDKGLQCSHFEVNSTAVSKQITELITDGISLVSLLRGQYFGLDKIMLSKQFWLNTESTTPHLLSVIEGTLEVRGEFTSVRLECGQSALIPAGVSEYMLHPIGTATLLCAFPQSNS